MRQPIHSTHYIPPIFDRLSSAERAAMMMVVESAHRAGLATYGEISVSLTQIDGPGMKRLQDVLAQQPGRATTKAALKVLLGRDPQSSAGSAPGLRVIEAIVRLGANRSTLHQVFWPLQWLAIGLGVAWLATPWVLICFYQLSLNLHTAAWSFVAIILLTIWAGTIRFLDDIRFWLACAWRAMATNGHEHIQAPPAPEPGTFFTGLSNGLVPFTLVGLTFLQALNAVALLDRDHKMTTVGAATSFTMMSAGFAIFMRTLDPNFFKYLRSKYDDETIYQTSTAAPARKQSASLAPVDPASTSPSAESATVSILKKTSEELAQRIHIYDYLVGAFNGQHDWREVERWAESPSREHRMMAVIVASVYLERLLQVRYWDTPGLGYAVRAAISDGLLPYDRALLEAVECRNSIVHPPGFPPDAAEAARVVRTLEKAFQNAIQRSSKDSLLAVEGRRLLYQSEQLARSRDLVERNGLYVVALSLRAADEAATAKQVELEQARLAEERAKENRWLMAANSSVQWALLVVAESALEAPPRRTSAERLARRNTLFAALAFVLLGVVGAAIASQLVADVAQAHTIAWLSDTSPSIEGIPPFLKR